MACCSYQHTTMLRCTNVIVIRSISRKKTNETYIWELVNSLFYVTITSLFSYQELHSKHCHFLQKWKCPLHKLNHGASSYLNLGVFLNLNKWLALDVLKVGSLVSLSLRLFEYFIHCHTKFCNRPSLCWYPMLFLSIRLTKLTKCTRQSNALLFRESFES